MQVSQIYVYPIKSMRPTALQSSAVTRDGLPYDRHFMLLQVKPDGRLVNMHIDKFPQLALFHTGINSPSVNDSKGDGNGGSSPWVTVTYAGVKESTAGIGRVLRIPLQPETASLKQFEVRMHRSPTAAFDMGVEYASWFSAWLGFSVVFAYIGLNRRLPLGNMTFPYGDPSDTSSGWLSAVSKMPYLDVLRRHQDKVLTFADMAPYLVVSQASVDAVSARLPPGEPMDVTRFRPNIVLSGCREAFAEDFWGELVIGGRATVQLRNNCVRCVSVNVDLDAGKPHAGEAGTVLKKLMRDRRVDKGAKYSPVFGRYGFLHGREEGQTIRIGDAVEVSRLNAERTVLGESALPYRPELADKYRLAWHITLRY